MVNGEKSESSDWRPNYHPLIYHSPFTRIGQTPDLPATHRRFRYRCSVPGLAGFTKTAVVRSPKSDNLSKHFRLPMPNADWFYPTLLSRSTYKKASKCSCQSAIGNRKLAMIQIAVLR